MQQPILSLEEKAVVHHFEREHTQDTSGRFVVPLPMKTDVTLLGESRSQAVRRFLNLEKSQRSKQQFEEFAEAIEEYFDSGHAELIAAEELRKPCSKAYYLPMHIVKKEDSTTSKVRVVFDTSAKTTTGASLNDQFVVGPTVHSSLIDVLL